jgi:hypothetical protein
VNQGSLWMATTGQESKIEDEKKRRVRAKQPESRLIKVNQGCMKAKNRGRGGVKPGQTACTDVKLAGRRIRPSFSQVKDSQRPSNFQKPELAGETCKVVVYDSPRFPAFVAVPRGLDSAHGF